MRRDLREMRAEVTGRIVVWAAKTWRTAGIIVPVAWSGFLNTLGAVLPVFRLVRSVLLRLEKEPETARSWAVHSNSRRNAVRDQTGTARLWPLPPGFAA